MDLTDKDLTFVLTYLLIYYLIYPPPSSVAVTRVSGLQEPPIGRCLSELVVCLHKSLPEKEGSLLLTLRPFSVLFLFSVSFRRTS